MYDVLTDLAGTKVTYNNELVLKVNVPHLNINELKNSFYFVPKDDYFTQGSRYRTTSRVSITDNGYSLLPRAPLYQPNYVNKLASYGGIDREYSDVPETLLKTNAFDIMIKEWISCIPYVIDTFSIHQIRTTDNGNPTPEGAHRDGTDCTAIFIVNRHNIANMSGATQYWSNDGARILDYVFPEGTLITHHDKYFTHCASSIVKLNQNEPSYRDVFVLTSPEHGLNHEQEEYRKSVFVAKA